MTGGLIEGLWHIGLGLACLVAALELIPIVVALWRGDRP